MSIGLRQKSLLVLMIFLFAEGSPSEENFKSLSDYQGPLEKYNTGWSFHFDNDALSLRVVDRDYTWGLAYTLSGRRSVEYVFSLTGILNFLNDVIGYQKPFQSRLDVISHRTEFGLLAFTPKDITNDKAVRDDRPYASLLFLGNSQMRAISGKGIAFQSRVMIGLLGTGLAGAAQTNFHKLFDLKIPNGWKYEISRGGEPTLLYSLGIQKVFKHFIRSRKVSELNSNLQVNIGYITDLNVSVNWRFGRILSPCWSFNPHRTPYLSLGAPTCSYHKPRRELYFWAGGRISYQIYNALYQGQFRHSEVSFSGSQLYDWIWEGWIGMTVSFLKNTEISFYMRTRRQQLKIVSRRDPVWVGLILRKTN